MFNVLCYNYTPPAASNRSFSFMASSLLSYMSTIMQLSCLPSSYIAITNPVAI